MSGQLDIGQIPDRPATPSTSSEASQHSGDAKARVVRDEDVADGETKPESSSPAAEDEADAEGKSDPAAGGEGAPRKKGKKPAVDYVRPDVTANKVRHANIRRHHING